jgi:leucyl aminopeptidase
VAACENMINERAYVPSDIVTAMNGMTIEIANTDAEGRLTLADALCYADQHVKCDKIIELSTLTGGCIVSLGRGMCGTWTDCDILVQQILDASKKTGDKAWRMPLEKEYNEHMDSMIADIKNLGIRWGGAIHAALFLTNFVDSKKPFAHLDIAGPAWNEKMGATGFGVKLLYKWLIQQPPPEENK